MLKVLAVVLAVLSAAISITIYSATLPAVQKQAADNAEAIQTLGGSVSDNAAAIETLEDKKLYLHQIRIAKSTSGGTVTVASILLNIYSEDNTAINSYTLFSNKYISSQFHILASGMFKDSDDNECIATLITRTYIQYPNYGFKIYGYYMDENMTEKSITLDNTFNFSDYII